MASYAHSDREVAGTAAPATPVALMVCTALASLALRLWLVDERWINPDEGAHLMDAVFALEGKIPLVDFAARQPFYVYLLSGTLSLLGPHFEAGRYFAIACSMATGVALFFLGRQLYDRRTAAIAACLYWAIPLEILNSAVLKTEPPSTLLAVLSLLAIAKSVRGRAGSWLVAAGVLAALSYNVRQSAIFLPIVLAFYLWIQHGRRLHIALLGYVAFLVGYVATFGAFVLFYSQYLDADRIWKANITPSSMVRWAFETLEPEPPPKPTTPPKPAEEPAEEKTEAVPSAPKPEPKESLTVRYLRSSVQWHAYLLIGLGLAFIDFLVRRWKVSSEEARIAWRRQSIVFLWPLWLAVAYAFYCRVNTFHIDYFREFFPALALASAAFLTRAMGSRRVWVGAVLVGLTGGLAWLVQREFPEAIGVAHHGTIAVCVLLATLLYTTPGTPSRGSIASLLFLSLGVGVWGRQPPLNAFVPTLFATAITAALLGVAFWQLRRTVEASFRGPAHATGVFLVYAAFVWSVGRAAPNLDYRYDSIWSPDSVAQTSEILRQHTSPRASVMSGGVIWEFESGRRAYHGVSHPLIYNFEDLPIWRQRELDRYYAKGLPDAIVLDGYTEKTYLRHLPQLRERLGDEYVLVGTAGPARVPVRTYVRKPRAPGQP